MNVLEELARDKTKETKRAATNAELLAASR
jgi:hypothetical protein